jgi:NAD(P)H-quinone oxidoreductase subunit 5
MFRVFGFACLEVTMSTFGKRMPGLVAETGIWILAAFSAGALVWTTLDASTYGLVGLHLDRLTTTLALLVAVVGGVTFRFSRRYLLGEPGQVRFLRWQAAAIVSAMLLMLSGNLILLWATWTFTSIALHKLLTHYAHRPEAWPPARKKFLISRLGDVALITAIAVIAVSYGTTDLGSFLNAARVTPNALPVQVVATCVVLAALTKSAQFPFHSWLPETMEAPTPVSALMHAGIINAGGALVLKFAPALAMAPLALSLLVGVGVVTAILGMFSMWAQTNVKRTLAWSTVSQMGFMMIQLGLGVFPVAVLHIVGHGCYKAWNFLACGWVVPAAGSQPMPPARHLTLVALGTVVAMTVITTACFAFGIDLWHHPGEATLAAVIALAIGQLWPIVMTTVSASRMASTLGLTIGASFIALAMHRGATAFFEPLFEQPAILEGPLGWALGAVVLVATIALMITHAMLPVLSRAPLGRAVRTHALHGFYCGAVADRVVRLLPFSPVPAGAQTHA